MIVEIIAILIGIMIACTGIYYFFKERHDTESKKIYTITTLIGMVIAIGALIKILIIS